MTRILLENITKIFDGETAAVSDFTLEIPEGCFMVIVGPSGCGKTTTLRLIAGLEQPDSGNIYIGDTLANETAAKNRDVAMVFQNYVLYPHMTAFQNMAFALKMRKFPGKYIKERVRETAKLLGIEDLLRRKPHALSGGQRQRVALGKAIVRKPSAFLLDEPLSNLDAKMRLAMRTELKTLHQKLKTTTVYVTHDQVEAMTLGERVCVMYNGKIMQTGKPMEIYEKPVNRFVAGFFGTPPMNFIDGKVKIDNSKIHFVTHDNTIILPQSLMTCLNGYQGKEMILGIRPENVSQIPYANQEDNTLTAIVEIVEPVGNKTDVYLRNSSGERLILCTIPYTDLRVNQTVKIHIDINKIHIFEPDQTGKNVIFYND
ncbi:MAG: ABC transporter ATP-binding protein [Sedimentisphaerales bacterium]|nr:ABC transporter ATP-binding protein [Sedimentisphaerales bacterium]